MGKFHLESAIYCKAFWNGVIQQWLMFRKRYKVQIRYPPQYSCTCPLKSFQQKTWSGEIVISNFDIDILISVKVLAFCSSLSWACKLEAVLTFTLRCSLRLLDRKLWSGSNSQYSALLAKVSPFSGHKIFQSFKINNLLISFPKHLISLMSQIPNSFSQLGTALT